MQLRVTQSALLHSLTSLRLSLVWLVFAFLTPIVAASAQPSPGSLTPPVAAGVIAKDPRFASASVLSLVNPEESVKAGISEGLWNEESLGNVLLAEPGRRYFSQVHGFPNYALVLIQPARRQVVNVTTITNVPNSTNLREVSFHWRYVGLPPLVARYSGQGPGPHASKALLRLSDDVWRVEQLMLSENARVRFTRPSADALRKEANDTRRFLDHLHQSARPGRQLGTFAWPDHKVMITDVGFRLEDSGMASCYWFGQVDRIQVERRPGGPKNTRREITAWRRDNLRPTTMAAIEGQLGDFAALERALASAYRAWSAKYADVAAELKAAGQAANFADLAKQARQHWFNEEQKTVICDDGLTAQSVAQLPAGLTVGGKWTGSIDSPGGRVSPAAELEITSISTASITYNNVRETLELQIGSDGEIVLRGVAHEFVAGPTRVFNLDTFRGRLSPDAQSITGTWKDAGAGGGQWSVSPAK